MLDEVLNEMEITNHSVDTDKLNQRKQLKSAYKMIDDALNEIKISPACFRDYLKMQSKFPQYTPRNAMLILKQMPDAIQVKEADKWKEAGVGFISDNPKRILLLDPKENKDDDRPRIYAKEVIDISETDTRPRSKTVDKKMVLQALINASQIDFKVVDNLNNDKVCEFNADEMALFYVKESNTNDELTIQNVASEVAKVFMYDRNQSQDLDDDKANCISYMLCLKYGIPPQIDVSENMVNKYKDMERNDVADDLSSMTRILLKMDKGMERYIDSKQKSDKAKEQER